MARHRQSRPAGVRGIPGSRASRARTSTSSANAGLRTTVGKRVRAPAKLGSARSQPVQDPGPGHHPRGLAALIGIKFEDYLNAPARRTEILVDITLSWAQRFIVKVASLEIMSVFDNHTFQPKRIINRAELADAAVRLIGVLQSRGARFVPLVETRRIQIADVSPDNHYHEAITRALAYQIMTLTPERNFEPERTVSGEEAVRVLDLVLRLAK
jgi:hypothetical protein